MWKEVHKNEHEKSIAELNLLKIKLDGLDRNSKEYKELKVEYDIKYQSAEDFFMKFQES